jgi:hypothetical protein
MLPAVYILTVSFLCYLMRLLQTSEAPMVLPKPVKASWPWAFGLRKRS